MRNHEVSQGLRHAIELADATQSTLVTGVGGRLAILLPMPVGAQAQAEALARTLGALENAVLEAEGQG